MIYQRLAKCFKSRSNIGNIWLKSDRTTIVRPVKSRTPENIQLNLDDEDNKKRIIFFQNLFLNSSQKPRTVHHYMLTRCLVGKYGHTHKY